MPGRRALKNLNIPFVNSDAFTGDAWLSYEATIPFLLLIPLAYAIRRHNLLALDRALNRSLVVLTLAVLLAGFYLLLATLVAAFIFHPLRRRLQKLADRLFYGGWYDYRAIIRKTSARLNRVSDPTQLAEHLVDAADAMRFQAAAFLWSEGKTLALRSNFGYEPDVLNLLRLPIEGALGQYLKLEVRDDGRGFVVPTSWLELARQGRLGLLGAAEQAGTAGGRLEVVSAPDEGTVMRVVAPRPDIAPSSDVD